MNRQARGSGRAAQNRIAVSDERGVRYLHFGTAWVQGAMRVRKPWDIELDYLRHMMAWQLFLEPDGELLQIGLGAGSLSKFGWRYLPAVRTVVAEIDPAVLAVARTQFGLPADDERLEVVLGDGLDYVGHPRNRGRFLVVQVDAYDAQAQGPVLSSLGFYQSCRRALARPGMLVVNLFGLHPSLETNLEHIWQAFDGRVVLLPPVEAGNVIALAFTGERREIAWSVLHDTAQRIEDGQPLKAHGWVNALRERYGDGREGLSC